MVGAGLGIALAPRTAVMNRLASIKVISLGGTVPARRVLVVIARTAPHTPVETAFHKLLVEIGTSYDPGLSRPRRGPLLVSDAFTPLC